MIPPMLAKVYEPGIEFPVYSQPKLDGIRCLISKHEMVSRNLKPIVACPHIRKSLDWFFERCPDTILDGELYNHDLRDNFNKICSLVKKQKPSPQDLEESKVIKFYIYDIVNTEYSTHKRMDIIDSANFKDYHLVQLPTTFVKNNHQLDKLFQEYLSDGYEGQMIRFGDSKYSSGRSSGLLKRKQFQDNEYQIVDILEGKGKRIGVAGSILLTTPEGKSFKSSIVGDMTYCKKLLEGKEDYIGKQGTVRFQNLTPEGVPRFPELVAIRDYE